MKKMISIVLALFVCISSMGMFGILADGEVQVQAGTVQGASGDTVEVELTLTGNPGLSYLKLRIGYDASVLTLTNAENTGALGTADFTASENFGKNPYVLTWASASNLEGNGVIAKLTFEIDEDAASGSSEITVECADSNNEDLQDVAVTTVNGSVEISSIKPEFVLGNAEGSIGDTVEVALTLNNNPGISYFKVQVGYDAEKLALSEVKTNSNFSLTRGNPERNPYSVVFSSADGFNQDPPVNGEVCVLVFEILDKTSSIGTSDLQLLIEEVDSSVNPGEIFNITDRFSGTSGSVQINDVDCEHNFTIVSVDDNQHKKVCSICEREYFEAHTWDEGKVTKEPSCTEAGVKTYSCPVCDGTKTETIAALDHDWDEGKVTKEPSCTEAGVKTYSCSRCEETRTETIAALDHDWDEGKVTKEPSCTEAGEKTYSCSRCEETRTETIAALDHDWDEGKVTKEPSCTEAGEKTYSCSRCEETRTEEITALGHSFTNYVYNNDATTTKDGTETAECDHGCGATDTRTKEGTKLPDENPPTGDSGWWFVGIAIAAAAGTVALLFYRKKVNG